MRKPRYITEALARHFYPDTYCRGQSKEGRIKFTVGSATHLVNANLSWGGKEIRRYVFLH